MNRRVPTTIAGALVAAALMNGGTAMAGEQQGRPPVANADAMRVRRIKDLRFGMWMHWSFGAFSGREFTDERDPAFFKATGCDTDQWCRTAKAAGMDHIVFMIKHHDGFCLWDTKTTRLKVTNSPLGIDLLAELRQSCDKYRIKLGLAFSRGEWIHGERGQMGGGPPVARMSAEQMREEGEKQKAQLIELCTQYGPIDFFMPDNYIGDGGLSNQEVADIILRHQPETLLEFAPRVGGHIEHQQNGGFSPAAEGYLARHVSYPIMPHYHARGARWFYPGPENDNSFLPPEIIYEHYRLSRQHQNVFSLGVGPDPTGKIRAIDVEYLQQVGQWIRNPDSYPGLPAALTQVAVTASSETAGGEAGLAVDGNDRTVWRSGLETKSAWLELGFPAEVTAGSVELVPCLETGKDGKRISETRSFRLEYARPDGGWQTLFHGGNGVWALGSASHRRLGFRPVSARRFRLSITETRNGPPAFAEVSGVPASGAGER